MKRASSCMAPVILGGTKDDMRLWQDESFASLAAYMIVGDDEKAVRPMRNTDYRIN